ncbi:MAG: PDDEXK nuclease domain-containing protein [Salinivirgaceae bacterium]|nr:PDDEXK nuclease domain-containing protein [Salinivirgaceae bacterium]
MNSPMNFELLVSLCQQTHATFQSAAERFVSSSLAARNWLIGWYIVEFEQSGEDRAAYGAATLKSLAASLKPRLGRGFSVDSLEQMRRFYLSYPSLAEPWMISGTLSRIFAPTQISETASRISLSSSKQQTLATQKVSAAWPGATPEVLMAWVRRFTLGWSHYVELLTLDDTAERRFYEIEAAANQWTVRELQRQIASSLYQRLALSRDKDEIRRLAAEGQVVEKAADLIKNPLVLEFLGLEDRPHYSEEDLESAIIDQLETFLLELGKGFLFEARQKRFTFDNDHFRVDLVFYNRLLRCYVLIDLKRDKLTHQDLGQMQMYVNYFDRHVKLPEELPTVGIVLCHRKNDALVELTLPQAANIFASKYQLYLPSKEELKARLEQITSELEGGAQP